MLSEKKTFGAVIRFRRNPRFKGFDAKFDEYVSELGCTTATLEEAQVFADGPVARMFYKAECKSMVPKNHLEPDYPRVRVIIRKDIEIL